MQIGSCAHRSLQGELRVDVRIEPAERPAGRSRVLGKGALFCAWCGAAAEESSPEAPHEVVSVLQIHGLPERENLSVVLTEQLAGLELARRKKKPKETTRFEIFLSGLSFENSFVVFCDILLSAAKENVEYWIIW